MNQTGFANHLSGVNWDNNTSMFNLITTKQKGKEHYVNRFTMQYAQHNPNKMPKLSEKQVKLMSDAKYSDEVSDRNIATYVSAGQDKMSKLQSFKLPKPDGKKKRNTFLALYNAGIPKGQKKFQLYHFDGRQYNRIPVLGSFGMSEYDVRSAMYDSNVNEQKTSPPKRMHKTIDNPVLTQNALGTQVSKGNLETVMNTIAKSDIADVSQVAKLLIPFMDSSVKLEVVADLKGRGKYSKGKHTIYIKQSWLNESTLEELARTVLKEYTHSITVHQMSKYLTEDGTQIVGTPPAHITALFRLYKATEKHLGKELETLRAQGREQGLTPRQKRVIYGGYNIYEFVEMMFTQPEFQKEMSGIDYKASGKSFYRQFVDLVSQLVDSILGKEISKDSITFQSMDAVITMLEEESGLPDPPSLVTPQDKEDLSALEDIDNQLSMFDTPKKVGFDIRGISPQKNSKDAKKAAIATDMIEFGRDTAKRKSSSKKYGEAAVAQGIPRNSGNYDSNTVAFVSVSGNNVSTKEDIDNTVQKIIEVLNAGGSIIMDNKSNRESYWNKSGEGAVWKQFTSQVDKGRLENISKDPDFVQVRLKPVSVTGTNLGNLSQITDAELNSIAGKETTKRISTLLPAQLNKDVVEDVTEEKDLPDDFLSLFEPSEMIDKLSEVGILNKKCKV
jgi:hypothetical protein